MKILVTAFKLFNNFEKRTAIYSEEKFNSLEQEILLILKFKQALEKDELQVYLQPKVDIFTKKVVGAESLVYLVAHARMHVVLVGHASVVGLCVECGVISYSQSQVFNYSCFGIKVYSNLGFHNQQGVLLAIPIVVSCVGRQFQPSAEVIPPIQ